MDARDVAANYCLEFDPVVYFRPGEEQHAKAGLVQSPNSCVYFLARRLEANDKVKSFKISDIPIEYWHPIERTTHGTFFDMDVEYVDGSRKLIYVTPQIRMHTEVEETIISLAEDIAKTMKVGFEVLTEIEIFGDNPAYMKSIVRYVMDKLYLKFPPASHPLLTPD